MYNKTKDQSVSNGGVSQSQEKPIDSYRVNVDSAKPETFTLELTREELDFLYERCSRKAQRLEEVNLTDIPCYKLSWQVIGKINKIVNKLQTI